MFEGVLAVLRGLFFKLRQMLACGSHITRLLQCERQFKAQALMRGIELVGALQVGQALGAQGCLRQAQSGVGSCSPQGRLLWAGFERCIKYGQSQ